MADLKIRFDKKSRSGKYRPFGILFVSGASINAATSKVLQDWITTKSEGVFIMSGFPASATFTFIKL